MTTPNDKVNTAQVKHDVSELFFALAWPKQLSNNPTRYLHTQQPRTRVSQQQPQSYKETAAALHGLQKGKDARFPTLSPQCTILHVIAGENYTDQKMEKGTDSQFMHEGKRHNQ